MGEIMADAELPQGQIENGVHKSTEAFKTVIDQSKQKIAEAEAHGGPAKRGRGRPRKIKVSVTPASDSPSVTSQPSVAGPTPAPDISQYLIGPLVMISRIPANNYGIPEIALTPDEAGLCAMSLNHLMQVFVPDLGQMSPKTAAVISAFSTFGGIGFQKYQIYLFKMRERNEKAKAEVAEKVEQRVNPEDAVFPTVHATDHFKRSIQ